MRLTSYHYSIQSPLVIMMLLPALMAKAQKPVEYVNPFIGTGFHGHVFLGANIPFGAVQLGPVNLSEGWDWCSGVSHRPSQVS